MKQKQVTAEYPAVSVSLEEENQKLRRETERLRVVNTAQKSRLEETERHNAELRYRLKKEPLVTLQVSGLENLRSAFLIADPNGNVVYGNTAAGRLFGDVAETNIFSLMLDEMRSRAPARSEDSVVQAIPIPHGHALWRKLRGGGDLGEVVCERVYLRSPVREGDIDAIVVMKYVFDDNGHPWVHIEVTDFDALNRDDLTGLFRGEVVVNAIRREIGIRERESDARPLSVIVFDIDDFKRFNDTYGHAGGDKVLRKVASAIDSQVRDLDMVGRKYTGDEFIVMAHASEIVAHDIAQRICERVCELEIRLRHKDTGVAVGEHASVSAGVASRIPGDTPEMLIERADTALYDSKENGKGHATSRRMRALTPP